jgi:formylglycine-generating enzyme required for sulfatase activity
MIHAPIQEQTSGGPVILNGRVVGMVQRRDPSGQFGYAVTAQAIREYVAGNQPTAAAGETFRDCEQCPEMVVIPGGKFMMGGSTEWEAYNYRELAAARPQHEVTIRGPLAVGKYKITRDEWDACVAARVCPNHRIRSADQGKSPIFDMTWFEAQAYVSWLAKKTGKPYRLLSEAEWEYAARAGSKEQTAPAGSLEPNRFGLHGMLDHVGEWVQDCWHETYYGAPTDSSAWESGACTERVVRSRYYELSHSMTSDKKARIAWRAPYKPGYRYDQEALGLRVARTL